MPFARLNTQQLQLPPQDVHKMGPVSILPLVEEGVLEQRHRVLSLSRGFIGNQWLLGEEDIFSVVWALSCLCSCE